MHQLLRHVATTVIVLPLLGFSLKVRSYVYNIL
jgi:hypothetical protein